MHNRLINIFNVIVLRVRVVDRIRKKKIRSLKKLDGQKNPENFMYLLISYIIDVRNGYLSCSLCNDLYLFHER